MSCWWIVKNLITGTQEVQVWRMSTLLTYALVSFFSCSYLAIKSSRFILSLFHFSLAHWSVSTAKSFLLRLFPPWFISLLKGRLVPLKSNAFITEPSMVNNTDIIYFIITRRQPWKRMVPQKFHDPHIPWKVLHSSFILCTTYVFTKCSLASRILGICYILPLLSVSEDKQLFQILHPCRILHMKPSCLSGAYSPEGTSQHR